MIRYPAFGIPSLGCTSCRHLPSVQTLGPPGSFRRSFVKGSKGVKASYAESFQPRGFPPSPNDSSVNQPGVPRGQSSRIFVGHSVFKGKAALTFQPRAPEFSALDSGGIKLSKEGCMFFEFAPAVGVRQYDWSRKQVFALSVLEIGTLLSLGPNESCEFFHDPFMGKSEAGKIRKVLKVDPLPENAGYFFSLSVANRILNVDEHLNIPVTKAEFAVMQSAFHFILPHLMGWNLFVDSMKPDELVHFVSGNSGSQERSSFEWDAPF